MNLLQTTLAAVLAVVPVAAIAEDTSRTFTCTFEPAVATKLADGKFVEKPVMFKDMTTPWVYKFTLANEKMTGGSFDVDIHSEHDFAHIAGRFHAFAVANATYVIDVLKKDNCMFSDRICGAFIQLTGLNSDEPAASINPISYMGRQDNPKFFHVLLVGRCEKVASAGSEK